MAGPTRSARNVLTAAVAAQVSVSVVNFGLPAIGPELGALVDAAGWDALWLTTACIAALGVGLASRLSDGTHTRAAAMIDR